MRIRRLVTLLAAVAALAATSACSSEGSESSDKDIRLDYAYYNPLSLVVRDQKLLENQGYKVTWVLSAGSNKANEGVRSNALDFGSTAGSAALVARANGTPLKVVDVYSQPEWTALVVAKDSPITSVAELKGKKIAVTKGTDPYFFLLQALDANGLSASDVEIVNLQHADGKTALERGDVDAWSGLDPFMAQTVQEQGARLLYRNPEFNSYGVLNVREDFSAAHPDTVQAVVNSYEEARKWALEHPAELTTLLAREAKISQSVAEGEMERTALDIDPVPGTAQTAVLEKIVPIAVADGDIKSEQAAQEALGSLLDPQYAQRAD
ncbi:aliphatic sulfonate ABC transporter substrate-binding protein [Mycolicibacterium goodii]|jgi:sulfonate transport system substrate-binding protein|uniref:Putative aliphatic sulfonates-binding protein n=1 Tax=Mycolicibacterium goodii TaxID=134601 RepID=A0A0K0X0L5_MYCGD|nr:ABC transporter substrate-binding protein [Mycolicibacterium goodii]